MGCWFLLSLSLLLTGQGPINYISQEKVNKYVAFADSGEEISWQADELGRVVSRTHGRFVDYHGKMLMILYSKGTTGTTSLSTSTLNDSHNVMLTEQNAIDGIPERVVDFNGAGLREFSELNPQQKRETIANYSQIINFVVDSLPQDSSSQR